jgi:hypothetical protein
MGTIAENLTALQNAKTAIKAAIEKKGQSLTNVPFTQYASKIEAIKTSSAPTTITAHIVKGYDVVGEVRRIGNIVIGAFLTEISIANLNGATIPDGFRPKTKTTLMMLTNNVDEQCWIYVNTNGTIEAGTSFAKGANNYGIWDGEDYSLKFNYEAQTSKPAYALESWQKGKNGTVWLSMNSDGNYDFYLYRNYSVDTSVGQVTCTNRVGSADEILPGHIYYRTNGSGGSNAGSKLYQYIVVSPPYGSDLEIIAHTESYTVEKQ